MKRCHTASASLMLLIGLFASYGLGQTPRPLPGNENSSAGGAGRAIQALWSPAARQPRAVRFSDYVDVEGNRIVVPAGYSAPCAGCGCANCGSQSCGTQGCGSPCCGPQGCYRPGGPGVYGACPPPGTCPPFGYNDDMADMMGGGFVGMDQCGPHYFDARLEFVSLTRTETFEPTVFFTSEGPNAGLDPALFRLSSNQLDYEYSPAFRVMGRYDIGPLAVFEFGYMGLHDQGDEAFVELDPIPETVPPIDGLNQLGDLYSLFSLYGTAPANVVVENGPMETTDRAVRHSIAINSDLQTAEMSYRRYWCGNLPTVTGTIFVGARYTRLSEQFNFSTFAEQGRFTYDVDAENDIVGLQTGGDMWVCVAQGVRMGTEGKAGIYNNRYKLDTNAISFAGNVTPTTIVDEGDRGNNIAFISELSFDVVVDILPSWSIRAGYEYLWINSVTLAGKNFNPASPFGLAGQPTRVPFVAEQDNVIYHGWHVGTEYIW